MPVEVIDRLFCGVFPEGIGYADRTKEKDGDYLKLAFLSFRTLDLEFRNPCSPELRERIVRDAAAIQATKGEEYVTSGTEQTITLGYGLR